jgi:hypothetical protein
MPIWVGSILCGYVVNNFEMELALAKAIGDSQDQGITFWTY